MSTIDRLREMRDELRDEITVAQSRLAAITAALTMYEQENVDNTVSVVDPGKPSPTDAHQRADRTPSATPVAQGELAHPAPSTGFVYREMAGNRGLSESHAKAISEGVRRANAANPRLHDAEVQRRVEAVRAAIQRLASKGEPFGTRLVAEATGIPQGSLGPPIATLKARGLIRTNRSTNAIRYGGIVWLGPTPTKSSADRAADPSLDAARSAAAPPPPPTQHEPAAAPIRPTPPPLSYTDAPVAQIASPAIKNSGSVLVPRVFQGGFPTGKNAQVVAAEDLKKILQKQKHLVLPLDSVIRILNDIEREICALYERDKRINPSDLTRIIASAYIPFFITSLVEQRRVTNDRQGLRPWGKVPLPTSPIAKHIVEVAKKHPAPSLRLATGPQTVYELPPEPLTAAAPARKQEDPEQAAIDAWLRKNKPTTEIDWGPHREIVLAARDMMHTIYRPAHRGAKTQWLRDGAPIDTVGLYDITNKEREARGLAPIKAPSKKEILGEAATAKKKSYMARFESYVAAGLDVKRIAVKMKWSVDTVTRKIKDLEHEQGKTRERVTA